MVKSPEKGYIDPMKLFQMLVFTAVMFSNIRWQWVHNSYAAALGAAIVTYYATTLLVKAIEAGYLGQRASQRLRMTVERLERSAVLRNSGSATSRRA